MSSALSKDCVCVLLSRDEQKRFVVGNIFVLQRERERDCRIQSFRVLQKPKTMNAKEGEEEEEEEMNNNGIM